NDALARKRTGDSHCPPHFLGDIARLIIGEVMLPPEFEGVGDGRGERGRLRLSRWSTHSKVFSCMIRRKKPAIPAVLSVGISHSRYWGSRSERRKIYGKRFLSPPCNRKFLTIGGSPSTQEPVHRGSTNP